VIDWKKILINKFIFGLKSGEIKDRVYEEKLTESTTLAQVIDIAKAKETYLLEEVDRVNWLKKRRLRQFENYSAADKNQQRDRSDKDGWGGDNQGWEQGQPNLKNKASSRKQANGPRRSGNKDGGRCQVCDRGHTVGYICKYTNYKCNKCG